jgi:hypothetical protein
MRRHPYASAMLAREGSGAPAPLLAPSVESDTRVTGMVRPLTGLVALTEAMAPHDVTLADGSHDIASPSS